MKTKSCLLLVSLFLWISANARVIPEEHAYITANAAISLYSGHDAGFYAVDKVALYLADDSTPLFYICQLNPKGYVIVSALYDLPPVIAYSFTGNIDPEGRFILFVKNDLICRKKNIQEVPLAIIEKRHDQWNRLIGEKKQARVFQQWPEPGRSPAEGWLETNWTQNEPYNLFCPLDPVTGTRSVAGCPAVAMAQILNFHATTSNVHFSDDDDYYHNYAGRQYWIDDDYQAEDFPSFPQLNDYLSSLKSHYQQCVPLTDEDMATLVFACGVAAKQVFASNGSGTFGVSQAFDAYIKFNVAGAVLLDDTDTSIYTRMAQNVMDTLPVHLAVVDPGWTMGHNVVVDGYNTDHYFHLNFGWGGAYNGWYLLPDEMPFGLTVIEGAVVDIIPQAVMGLHHSMAHDFSLFPNPTDGELNIVSSIPVSRIEIFSLSGKFLTGQIFNDCHARLDLSGFDQGLYLIRIIALNSETWEKVVKE